MRLTHIIYFLFVLLLYSVAYPATINWIMGEAPPLSWGVDYSGTSLSNIVIISGGLDQSYRNKWCAEIEAGGTPVVTVDTSTNTIALWFDPSGLPGDKPLLLDPVCGLMLEIGPLADGDYIFTCTNPLAASTLYIQIPPPLMTPEPATSAFIVAVLCCVLKKHQVRA